MTSTKRAASQGVVHIQRQFYRRMACIMSFALVLLAWGMNGWRVNVDHIPLGRLMAQTPPAAAAVSAPAQVASAPQATASQPSAAVAQTPTGDVYYLAPGASLSAAFGKDWQVVCKASHIRRCEIVQLTDRLIVPADVKIVDGTKLLTQPAGQVATKSARPKEATLEATRVVRRTPMLNDAGEILYHNVGTAPLNGCSKRDILAIAEEAWAVLGISEEDRAWLRLNIDAKGGPRLSNAPQGIVKLVPDMRLERVTFCRDGKVVSVGPMRTAWNKDAAVYGEKFVLPSGKTLVWMRNCFNWVTWIPEERPSPQPAPPASAPTPPPAASAPDPTPDPQPRQPDPQLQLTPEEDEVVANYDRDLTVYAGGDRDVRFAGGEGAFYPWLSYYNWGRYALGVGAFANLWEGATPQDFDFGGRYGAVGVAQKLSTWDGQDLGFKFPMIGAFAEHGHNKPGFFRENREAKLWCASMSYNDARREKRGEKSLPEWVIWASFCDPFSQTKSRTVFGQPMDTSTMSDIRYILSVGGRVYLSKDLTEIAGDSDFAKKVQPFVELGLNKTDPNPFSAHLYGGLRGVKKVFGCGLGLHYSQAGKLPGATCNYDVGRHLWLSDKEERWAAMVKSLEALGVAVDD